MISSALLTIGSPSLRLYNVVGLWPMLYEEYGTKDRTGDGITPGMLPQTKNRRVEQVGQHQHYRGDEVKDLIAQVETLGSEKGDEET